MPGELRHAFAFAALNALSFQIVLGSPMVLYAQALGAGATVLGIVAGMMPLLVIFQIPAASHIERIGYKRFVFAGWGTRVMFIFWMALVPLTGRFLDPPTRLSLLLFLLFGFNLSRGISSTAWLPWITALVPLEVRGKYLARDAVCVHVASCATFLLAALCLGQQPSAAQFSLLFAFSAVMGAVSLVFLRRIPDAHPPASTEVSKSPVPWRAIASHPPFRKLLWMNVAWSLAYGGMAAFSVAYLKSEAGLSEGRILFVTGLAFLGGLVGLTYFESRTDHLGSKPVLTMALVVWLGILIGWALCAGRVFTARLTLLIPLELLMGFAYALVSMNNTRLAMVIVPTMGRSHFFALFSVVANLTLGLSPVLWGLIIDSFGGHHYAWAGFELNRFSLFFLAALVAFFATLVLCRRLDEPRARDMDALLQELLRSPQRLWLRLFPRG